MKFNNSTMTRRRFLTTTAKVGAVVAAPVFVPGAALGKDGGVAASERITVGGIGINARGCLCVGCVAVAAGHPVCGHLRRACGSAQGSQEDGRHQVRATRTARPIGIFVSCSHDRTSTPYSLPRATAGTPWPRSWRPRRARTSTWRSPVRCRWPRAASWPRRCDATDGCFSWNAATNDQQFQVRGRSGSQRETGKASDPARFPGLLWRGPERRAGSPRLASGKTGAAQGRTGLGDVAGTVSVAAVQSRLRNGPELWRVVELF